MPVFDASIKTVHVCPVEAFREAEEYLVSDPDECIDCAACIPECPAEAIYADTDLPEEEMSWLEKNEEEAPDLPIAGRLTCSGRPIVMVHYIGS